MDKIYSSVVNTSIELIMKSFKCAAGEALCSHRQAILLQTCLCTSIHQYAWYCLASYMFGTYLMLQLIFLLYHSLAITHTHAHHASCKESHWASFPSSCLAFVVSVMLVFRFIGGKSALQQTREKSLLAASNMSISLFKSILSRSQ